jgi:hypothetical protein
VHGFGVVKLEIARASIKLDAESDRPAVTFAR